MSEISVNQTIIPEAAILREMQYHPAETEAAARHAAAEWLVIRLLLLERATNLGLKVADEDAAIQALIEREVDVPAPDEESCRRYYENNLDRFRSPDLFEAAHILLPAAPEDEAGRAATREQAERLIGILAGAPQRFGELARAHSACSSKEQDGHLGQVARGDTVPELESFLYNLEAGQLCPVPVATRYGFHVLRLDRKILGRQLPYEAVADKIAEYLKSRSWRRAFSQYVQLLAGDAKISGFDISAAASPLVQ